MSLTQSRDRLLASVLELMWAQWTELGVAGVAGTESSVIDPEALLLATSRFGRYDPRLFDEVLDWLASFSDLLDVTRLRRLATQTRFADGRVVSALVDFMRQQSTAAKWERSARSLIAREDSAAYGGVAPLFLDGEGKGIPTFGEKDQFFLQHGIERPALDLRGMSTAPVSRKPAIARLRFRALMGAGARAEVLLYLATHNHAHGRLISARTGFAQRQVSEYLAQMAEAGFVERWEDGRTVQYRLVGDLTESMGPLAGYVDWPGAWTAIAMLLETRGIAEAAASSYEAAKAWRAGLESLKVVLPVEGLDVRPPTPERHSGEALLEYADEYLGRVVEALGTAR